MHLAVAVAVAVLAASCTSDQPEATAVLVTTTAPATTTTRPAPTTTGAPASTTTIDEVEETTTTITVAVVPTWPLTGLPVPFGFEPTRPAMVVKLDNHPKARPQSGLNEADIVFEENVEQLTRFAAVFQSNGTDPVGPIRSGRTQDVDLLSSFNNPLFVWSGGNRRVTNAILDSGLREISPKMNGPFFRTDRPGPHDLYADMTALYAIAPLDAGAPPAQFAYRPANEQADQSGTDAPAVVLPVAGVKVSMDGVRVSWLWNSVTEKFLRFSDDVVHKDTVLDAQVDTDNVLVMYLDYRPSPADGRSPEAQTIGTGELFALIAGTVRHGSWTRTDRLSPFVLTDDAGAEILLTPGRTFIELARVGKAAIVPAGVDAASVPYP